MKLREPDIGEYAPEAFGGNARLALATYIADYTDWNRWKKNRKYLFLAILLVLGVLYYYHR
jgi:hypothetical protein